MKNRIFLFLTFTAVTLAAWIVDRPLCGDEKATSMFKTVPVVKIWDAAPHSAFTDILRFHDQFFVAFREGTGHIPTQETGVGDGKIRILRSTDGQTWESAALLERNLIDLRDAKLSATPDDRILVTMGGSYYEKGELIKRVPQVAFGDAKGHFTAPEDAVVDPAIKSDIDWIWRVTWKDGVGYGVLDQAHLKPDWLIWLVKTTDGVHYENVCRLDVAGEPNESTIRFDADGKMKILVRREIKRSDGTNEAYFGTAAVPFTDWSWQKTGEPVGGPNLIYLPDGRLFAGGRIKGKTGLGFIESDGTFRQVYELPSGGDNSYPGFCLLDGVLWISYYSSHEGKTAIYLAKIPVSEL